jgi:hypothetical protein
MTVLAGSVAWLSYHQSKEVTLVQGVAYSCASGANPAEGYLNANHQVMLSCNTDDAVIQDMQWHDIGQYTAYATGLVPSYKCLNALCSKGKGVATQSTVWLWDIKNGLYVHASSDNPELFGENYVPTSSAN